METKTVTASELKSLIETMILRPFSGHPRVWIWIGFGGVRGMYIRDYNDLVFDVCREVGPGTPIVIHAHKLAIFVGGEAPTYKMDEEGGPEDSESK